MCTAVTYNSTNHYFGRNLDLEYSYNEAVTITPRNFPFEFRECPVIDHHYALIGIATVEGGYPLYYDAANEQGLSIAALNFPGNAHYLPISEKKHNIAPFELIPWVLSKCKSINEARELLLKTNIANIVFSDKFPLTPLHFLIADKSGSIVVEPLKSGLVIHENPIGILTNNPTFDMQMFNLRNYMHLSSMPPENKFSDKIFLEPYSNGMGALGLPGDLSSSSRFVRAAFTKLNSPTCTTENESISQFFHILSSVSHTRGSVMVGDKYEITVYSSCCNTDNGIYYYTTYENSSITAVNMYQEDLDSSALVHYPLKHTLQISYEN